MRSSTSRSILYQVRHIARFRNALVHLAFFYSARFVAGLGGKYFYSLVAAWRYSLRCKREIWVIGIIVIKIGAHSRQTAKSKGEHSRIWVESFRFLKFVGLLEST